MSGQACRQRAQLAMSSSRTSRSPVLPVKNQGLATTPPVDEDPQRDLSQALAIPFFGHISCEKSGSRDDATGERGPTNAPLAGLGDTVFGHIFRQSQEQWRGRRIDQSPAPARATAQSR